MNRNEKPYLGDRPMKAIDKMLLLGVVVLALLSLAGCVVIT